ncbi:MAG: sugar phosphate isomerase/epimerase [Eubacteriales bacterium]|nr:sugar phosphate isomerase/epimerase [Eubacteriales bacterium]
MLKTKIENGVNIMAKFVFSAFSDEITADFDAQLDAVKKLEIPNIELRGVDGKSFVLMSDEEVKVVNEKLEKSGVGLSALGTPLGKITLDDDFDEHLKLMDRIMDIGDMLGCKRLRIFSFYPGKNNNESEFRAGVIDRLSVMLDKADARAFTLCHENEKDIYGYSPERVLDLMVEFGGRLRVVLDSGNFSFCGVDAAPAYSMLKDYIDYLHIKDADEDGVIVPPGKGVSHLKETLSAISADFPDSEIIITMEPHLMMFTGLEGLSKLDDIKHKYSFETPFAAFEYATNSVREMVNSISNKNDEKN